LQRVLLVRRETSDTALSFRRISLPQIVGLGFTPGTYRCYKSIVNACEQQREISMTQVYADVIQHKTGRAADDNEFVDREFIAPKVDSSCQAIWPALNLAIHQVF